MINEETIRNSFGNVKKHVNKLEAELSQIRVVLEEIRAEIKTLKEVPQSEDSTVPQEDFTPISTGNQGVLSKQINEQASKQANEYIKQTSKQADLPKETKNYAIFKGLETTFKSLTKQEFHIFLLVYQLEDEGIIPTYLEIAAKLSLTLSCLRAHICSLIKKGVPIVKTRLKNNSITFSIDKDFKSIASQKKLIDFYYSLVDPSQTRLSTD